MMGKNTRATRIYPEDKQWLEEIAALRRLNRVDKKQLKSARAIKAMRNIIESDAVAMRKLKEFPLK